MKPDRLLNRNKDVIEWLDPSVEEEMQEYEQNDTVDQKVLFEEQ